ncbi:class I SAM-dependent methyltransferase [Kiloniella majae]|uniref:class I SAM-dependent methyltransferase n=1 Tax=Kiloniella majae TaxID=1938558 RepID=UPI000A2775E4|nr:class I SAM-dependent methyltransferase [Kiloniella majae]
MNSKAFSDFNIWDHSQIVKDLYRRRARDEVEEMTCAQQAIELLVQHAGEGDTLIDAGCGSGYFFHSIRRRNLTIDYHGFDQTESLINIGKEELPPFGLSKEKLQVCRLEDFSGNADHVLCLNVLSNIDNYHRPLERLLLASRKTLILRESIASKSSYKYVHDTYLDDDVHLNVHVNTYAKNDICSFIQSYGFETKYVVDQRTQGKPELVIGYPHHWAFIVARAR